jgi:hypothetical protein
MRKRLRCAFLRHGTEVCFYFKCVKAACKHLHLDSTKVGRHMHPERADRKHPWPGPVSGWEFREAELSEIAKYHPLCDLHEVKLGKGAVAGFTGLKLNYEQHICKL